MTFLRIIPLRSIADMSSYFTIQICVCFTSQCMGIYGGSSRVPGVFQYSVRLHQSPPVHEPVFDFSLIPLLDFLLSPSNHFVWQFISASGSSDGGPSFIRHLFFHLASIIFFFIFVPYNPLTLSSSQSILLLFNNEEQSVVLQRFFYIDHF